MIATTEEKKAGALIADGPRGPGPRLPSSPPDALTVGVGGVPLAASLSPQSRGMTMVASRILTPPHVGNGASLLETNRRFYEPLWERSRVVPPERFNTWPLVQSLLASSRSRLEVAPGLNPRLPIAGTRFVDMSAAAVAKLRDRGADATVGLVGRLPCAAGSFDLVAAFDIIEHADDDAALAELSRVTVPGATLLLSAPIHASRWSSFNELVGHGRRYEIDDLVSKLARHGWSVERSAVYGMKPRAPWLPAPAPWGFR